MDAGQSLVKTRGVGHIVTAVHCGVRLFDFSDVGLGGAISRQHAHTHFRVVMNQALGDQPLD